MKKLISTAALGAFALALAACGDNTADTTDTAATTDTAVTDATATTTAGTTTTTGASGWPTGARIVEEDGVTYRVHADNRREAIEDGSWRIVTENGVRYRVGPGGTRVRIDDTGLDVDLGVNSQGNLDLDVSTDGTDASRN